MSDFEKKTLGLLEEILSEVKHFNLKLPYALVTLKDIKDSLHVIESECKKCYINESLIIYNHTYKTWQTIKQRCNNKNDISYKYYGGKGIKICERWKNSFSNFLEDMGKQPEGFYLKRIDKDLNYYSNNCIWSRRKKEIKNKIILSPSEVAYKVNRVNKFKKDYLIGI